MSTAEQTALFADNEDDGALLFPADELSKRYTAEQAQQMEWKRNAILMLLGALYPVEVIARQLHVNIRTVTALARRNAREVAGFSKQYADGLLRLGAEAFGLAGTKMQEASYLQLVTGGGILTDKAVMLAQMGQGEEERSVKEDRDHLEAAAELRRLMSESNPPSDSESIEKAAISEGFGQSGGPGAGHGAAGLRPCPALPVATNGEGDGGAGGGAGGKPV